MMCIGNTSALTVITDDVGTCDTETHVRLTMGERNLCIVHCGIQTDVKKRFLIIINNRKYSSLKKQKRGLKHK